MSDVPSFHTETLSAACRELTAVPDELRQVLETCLSEEASQQTLDLYLPDVRKIITRLLQGLRSKQSIYRQVVSDSRQRSSTISDGAPPSRPESRTSRQSRRDTSTSTRSNQRDTVQSSDSLSRRSATSMRRKESTSGVQPAGASDQEPFVGGFAVAAPPQDGSRASTPSQAHARRDWPEPTPRPPSRASSATGSDVHRDHDVPPVPRPPSSMSQVPSHVKRYSLVDRPVSSPTPPPTAPTPTPPPAVVIDEAPVSNGAPHPQDSPPLPPPPPFLDSPPPDAPAVQSSLAALKQSDALERRASKRFSTYNISKMTGGSIRGGHPNRRSMAVTSALTPGDLAVLTEENEDEVPVVRRNRSKASQRSRNPSPIAEDEEESTSPAPSLAAGAPSRGPSPKPSVKSDTAKDLPPRPADKPHSPSPGPLASSSSFPVFLQVGREVKKVTIERGLSFASLRVLFVDKFSYSPGQDNFPAIYIRDPASGVQYELEDMDEVKEKCLLSLNIERKRSFYQTLFVLTSG